MGAFSVEVNDVFLISDLQLVVDEMTVLLFQYNLIRGEISQS